MKKIAGKYVGINQRVPFAILDAALYSSLKEGNVQREDVRNHLKEFFKGENRIGKASGYLSQMFKKNKEHITRLSGQIKASDYIKLPEGDRNAFLLCIVALTYPITYDLLLALASGFKVQSVLSSRYFTHKMTALYGSNRSVYNAVEAIIPMLTEIRVISRKKTGLYSIGERLAVAHPFISEFVVCTDIKLSGSKSILLDDIKHRSWYMYFEINFSRQANYRLLKFAESRLGQGYLTI